MNRLAHHDLLDISLLQAQRLALPQYEEALSGARFNPFPSGTDRIGNDEYESGFSHQQIAGERLSLAAPVLSSFDGALPDYIQEALLKGIHDGDDSFRDFLAIFDRRILELQIRASRVRILVSKEDATNTEAANILTHLLTWVSQKPEETNCIDILLPLLTRTRSLGGLRRVVSWFLGREVHITAHHGKKYRVSNSDRSRLSGRNREQSQVLGKGALLGRFGQISVPDIEVHIPCSSREELEELTQAPEKIEELQHIISQYLRDATSVQIYADILRKYLPPPRLSARKPRDRVGFRSLLAPALRPNQTASINLLEYQL